jgi:hypothetical protein
MGMNLPNPKAVLANEACPKGSPRPDSLRTLNKTRHRVGRPVCVVLIFSSLVEIKKLGGQELHIQGKIC